MPLYECTISMTYNVPDPATAAGEFIDNLNMHRAWFVQVVEVGTEKRYTVDTEDLTVEED